MADRDLYQAGLASRKRVLGDAYVEGALKRTDAFSEEFQRILTEYCWGEIWARSALSDKQRSLNNLCLLGALNRQHEFRLHLKGALTNGCTLEEIRDTLLQLAVYCGVPAGVEAFRIAAEVFREENIDTKELLRAPGD
jgi:4-carboxymuconolactone decarboxylase